MRTNVRYVLLLLVGLLLTSLSFAETMIIQDGKPNAEIIVAEQAAGMTSLAASQLQQHLATMTGATLPIVNAPSGNAAVTIYVGPSSYTQKLGIQTDDLDHDAYRMRSGDGWLALVGRDTRFFDMRSETATELLRLAGLKRSDPKRGELWTKWYKLSGGNWGLPYSQLYRDYNKDLDVWAGDEHGSFAAVADFLRSLGMRWYMPSELGQVIPKHASVALPTVDKTVKPDFPVRFANQRRFNTSVDEALWELWVGFNRGTDVIDATFPQHGITMITDTRTEYSLFAHPGAATPKPEDYYVFYGGKRQVQGPVFNGKRSGAKQCLSSPGLLAENVRFAKAYFDILESPMISVMPGDGYTSICQCERCKGKDSPELGYRGLLSNYVWGYTNDVARQLLAAYPDRKVLGTAYGTYMLPPTSIDHFSPIVVVCICQHRSQFGQDPEAKAFFQGLRKPFLDKLPKGKVLLMYEYYRGNRHTPHYSAHAIAQDLQALNGICLGDMIDVTRDSRQEIRRDGYTSLTKMSVQQLDLYVTGRFLWDSSQDIDAMLAEYCTLYYGPAAAEMAEMIAFGEAHWMSIIGDPAKIDRTLELLKAVQAKVDPETVYGQRVALLTQYISPLEKLREQGKIVRVNVPELIVNEREGQAITIDGKLDDPFWSDIRVWSKGKLRELTTGQPPAFKTSFRSGWANGSLYFGIRCEEAKGSPPRIGTTEHDQMSIWEGDCIEIMLEPPGHSYYQIAISPSGAVVDLDRTMPKSKYLEWESEVEVATDIGDGYWTVEVRIPAAGAEQLELLPFQGVAGNKPNPAFPWYFNICRFRNRGDETTLSAYSPSGQAKGGFHRPETFAKLVVGRPPRVKPRGPAPVQSEEAGTE